MEEMQKIQRPCHKSVSQSASGRRDGAHARRFPQIRLLQLQTLFPILTTREGVHIWAHSDTKQPKEKKK